MRFKTDKKPITAINAASMTDIVMLLLIFFLLSSSFVIQPGIQVKLPKAATTEVQSERNIIVTITSDREIFLNQERVDMDGLAVALLRALSAGDDHTIVLRTDQEVHVQQLVQVMDIAKSVGGNRFLIATQENEE